jgi:hypothetical protein
MAYTNTLTPGSAIYNRREPKSCLGQVFNSKLDSISILCSKCMLHMQPLLELKTQRRDHPVSLSLSMLTSKIENSVQVLSPYLKFVQDIMQQLCFGQ